MQNFTAHRLRFITEVQSTIELNEHQGSAIRGALFHAMRRRFCGNREADGCAACPLVAACPVATLVSTLKPGSVRGRDVPRPFTVQPPLPGEGGHPVEDDRGRLFFHYRPGERFEFGLTLYAQALQLFPYVVLTTKTFEDEGIGRRVKRDGGHWRRGTLTIQEVWAENPLTGERQPVIESGGDVVQVPDTPITHEQVCEWANGRMNEWMNGRMAIRFLTPTRIIEHGRLVKPHTFRFKPLFQRLLDRLESLSRDFSDTRLEVDFSALVKAAEDVRVVDNRLRWEELRSYSTRQRRDTPTSGLLGTVVLETDDWSPFLCWLAWGQFAHVGKDAVKGNGKYRICE
ncbi:MAG: CRISPR system precrRNA processing endoribonuclease RAMP protein Cas6 [Chloroflexota bacterium]|nr:CRISPR system precrRNA processing endoribonuclease RAMP protein Cas6 [Chloroflexota bacterium]